MKPGEIVTCAACGARARATFSSGAAAWREGYPVALTWTHGPHPRCHVVFEPPALCSWCFERRQALGADAPPLYRPAPDAPTGCYYLRDGKPTEGCRPTAACWSEACGAAGVARPAAPGTELEPELQLPPAEPADPPGQTYVEDLAAGRVAPFTPPAQLGLF